MENGSDSDDELEFVFEKEPEEDKYEVVKVL